jgi:hypothetical protein
VVELQSVSFHPSRNVINARRHALLQSTYSRWTTKTVDLRVVGIGMWIQLVKLHQLQQVSSVQRKQDWSKNGALWNTV